MSDLIDLEEMQRVLDAYDGDGFPISTDEVRALVSAVRAAQVLDRELSEEHSGFDSDRVYERYHRYPSEQGFRDALARFKP